MTITQPRITDDDGIDARTATARRVDKLNTASLRRVIEPDTEVAGSLGDGAVFARQLSTVAGLDLDLTDEQMITLTGKRPPPSSPPASASRPC